MLFREIRGLFLIYFAAKQLISMGSLVVDSMPELLWNPIAGEYSLE
jgi:hypothetical protein